MLSLEEIARKLQRNAGRVQLTALLRGAGEMKLRIFVNGEATDGTKLGAYRSKSHKRKRIANRRQITNKDLNLFGDLEKSVIVGEQREKAVLGITTTRFRKIAQGQEMQTDKEIFALSDSEIDFVFKTINAEVKALLNAR